MTASEEPTASATPTPPATASATATPSATAVATATPSATATAGATVTSTPTSSGPVGLRGEYFDQSDLTQPALTRVDPAVNFDWGAGAPDPSLGADSFSVRWSGQLQVERAGQYWFYTTSDDGVRLWVDGQLLINDWTAHGPVERAGSLALEVGWQPIVLEYFEATGGSLVRLSYASASLSKQIIPAARLAPSEGTLGTSPSAPASASPSPTARATATATATATVSTVVGSPTPLLVGGGSGGKWYGVNQAGAEFGDQALPGTRGVDYTYPNTASSYRYFAGQGQRLVRLPFRWERVQPAALGPLAEAEVAEIARVLDLAAANGQRVILDLHNYGRYYHTTLTPSEGPKLADVWRKLADRFQGHGGLYGYELMNEPHDLGMSGDQWRQLMQTTTDAIRQVDQSAYVLIPGTGWQSARFWRDSNEQLIVQDPAGKLLYAAHQYFDADYTGTYRSGYDAGSLEVGAQRIQPFLDWLTAKGVQGILTEYGVPDSDPRWLEVLERFLARVEASERLVGGTYWGAGPWWGSYPLSVEPVGGLDRPQMSVLARYPTHLYVTY